jgi:hypothetical protein
VVSIVEQLNGQEKIGEVNQTQGNHVEEIDNQPR